MIGITAGIELSTEIVASQNNAGETQEEAAQSKILVRKIKRDTDLAIQINSGNGHAEDVWLPKSKITMTEKEDGSFEIGIPGWLVEKHNLIDAPLREPEPEPEPDIPF